MFVRSLAAVILILTLSPIALGITIPSDGTDGAFTLI